MDFTQVNQLFTQVNQLLSDEVNKEKESKFNEVQNVPYDFDELKEEDISIVYRASIIRMKYVERDGKKIYVAAREHPLDVVNRIERWTMEIQKR